jgi:hypothetical protein
MVVYIFVDIEARKCIKCVREKKSPWYMLRAEYWKKVGCSKDGIEVNDRGEGFTVIVRCIWLHYPHACGVVW